MGVMINRRREMGGPDKGETTVSINVITHSIGNTDASLDVITGNSDPINIVYKNIGSNPWTNEYIQVRWITRVYNWRISAITSCLYNGKIYNPGDSIITWRYNETKDITIVANI